MTTENSIFTWESWDEVGPNSLNFYKCTLVIDVGEYTKGSKISTINLDHENSQMAFYNDSGKEIYVFNIKLSLA